MQYCLTLRLVARPLSHNASSKTQARRALYHNIYEEVGESATTASQDKIDALRGEAQLAVSSLCASVNVVLVVVCYIVG